jgi:hypothetical protein
LSSLAPLTVNARDELVLAIILAPSRPGEPAAARLAIAVELPQFRHVCLRKQFRLEIPRADPLFMKLERGARAFSRLRSRSS